MEIRSYRRVFDLERRIYSVDRLRLNPAGVPVRGVVYFLASSSVGLIVARVSRCSATVARAGAVVPARSRAARLRGATVLALIRVEGRTFHLRGPRAAALLDRAATAGVHRRVRGSAGQRWHPHEIVLALPDGSDSRMRRLRYTGPGAVLVAVEHERRGRATEPGRSGMARRGLRRGADARASRGAALRWSPAGDLARGRGATAGRVRARPERRDAMRRADHVRLRQLRVRARASTTAGRRSACRRPPTPG